MRTVCKSFVSRKPPIVDNNGLDNFEACPGGNFSLTRYEFAPRSLLIERIAELEYLLSEIVGHREIPGLLAALCYEPPAQTQGPQTQGPRTQGSRIRGEAEAGAGDPEARHLGRTGVPTAGARQGPRAGGAFRPADELPPAFG